MDYNENKPIFRCARVVINAESYIYSTKLKIE